MKKSILFATRGVALFALAAGHVWGLPAIVPATSLAWLGIGDWYFSWEHRGD